MSTTATAATFAALAQGIRAAVRNAETADALAALWTVTVLQADALQETNPRFVRERFYAACGFTTDGTGRLRHEH